MCVPTKAVEPVVKPVIGAVDWTLNKVGIKTSKSSIEGEEGVWREEGDTGTSTQGNEPPKAPQVDPEQMAKIRAAGDDERRRALLRIGRASTKKTGSLGLPGDPFTATRKLLGG